MTTILGRRAAQVLVLITWIISSTCKRTEFVAPTNYKGFIIGADNMVASDSSTITYNGASLSEIRSTGAIASLEKGRGTHFCTGFLINPSTQGSNPRVVSNYHCFTNSGENSGPFADWACTQTKIYLGLKVDDFNSLYVVGCKAGSLKGHAQADIAVFEVDSPVPGDIKVLELETAGVSAQSARIIHHPVVTASMVAPPGELQKLPGSVITREGCSIQTTSAGRRERPSSGFLYDISHTCDIVEGSSGAPIISATTGKVVGVNWGGIEWTGETPPHENRAIASDWLHAYLNDNLASFEAKMPNSTVAKAESAPASQPVKQPTRASKSSPGGCAISPAIN